MPVTLTAPVAGLDRGKPYSGPMEDWLVANGYAKADDDKDKVNVTGVKADKDPTLAENREAPGDELTLFGDKAETEAEAPVETGEREPEPLPVVEVPFIGAEQDDEVAERKAQLDGSDVEVKEGFPEVQEESVEAAEKSAGTGDNLLDEPTEDTAPIEDAPEAAPAPARRKKAAPKAQ